MVYTIPSRTKRSKLFVDRTGELIYSKYGKILIVDYRNKDDVQIKFLNTGTEYTTRYRSLIAGKIMDPMYPSMHGVGYIGLKSNIIAKIYPNKFRRSIYKKWTHMINCCYNKSDKLYNTHGGLGITVDPRWHNYSNFFYDIFDLPGYNKVNIYKLELDKDKLQSHINKSDRIYSRETCCWLSRVEHTEYHDIDYDHSSKDRIKEFMVIYPDGREEIVSGINKFARTNNLSVSAISWCLSCKCKSHKGYKFRLIDKV